MVLSANSQQGLRDHRDLFLYLFDRWKVAYLLDICMMIESFEIGYINYYFNVCRPVGEPTELFIHITGFSELPDLRVWNFHYKDLLANLLFFFKSVSDDFGIPGFTEKHESQRYRCRRQLNVLCNLIQLWILFFHLQVIPCDRWNGRRFY